MECRSESLVHLGPEDALSSSRFVLQTQQRELVALLGCSQIQLGDDATGGYPTAASQRRQFRRFRSAQTIQQRQILFQRMAGDVETEGRLLCRQQFTGSPPFYRRRNFIGDLLLHHSPEQTCLPHHPFSLRSLGPRQRPVNRAEGCPSPLASGSIVLKRVEGSSAHQTLKHPLVQGRTLHPFGEIVERFKRTVGPRIGDGIYGRLSESLDGSQAIPDRPA